MLNKTDILDKIGLNGLIDFLYPPVCLCCGHFLENSRELICAACFDGIDELDFPFCSNCRQFIENKAGCGDCDETAIPVFCLGHFTDELQKAIHSFKYHGFRKLSGELAGRLMNKFASNISKVGADCIIPIPLHIMREKSRGFNQAALLADIIGERIGIPVVTDVLFKVRRTRDQAKLDPEQRRKNIEGAFEVHDHSLKDKKVIIVDDVVTTGATVNEAAATLRRAGARPVAVCAVAAAGF